MSWELLRLNVDRRTVLVLVPAALIMVFMQYYGLANHFEELFPGIQAPEGAMELLKLLWWCAATWLGYLVIPALLIWGQGMKLRDFGLRMPVGGAHLWLYAVLFLGSVPFLVSASSRDSFLDMYPFYRPGLEHPVYWLIFEIAYVFTFVTVEFFFRGFLIFGLEKRLGDVSVLVAAIPYCMVHFGKPMPETLAAIVGAIVLGTLALRTRSIYGGVIVHQLIALTMDALALLQRTQIPAS